jgi:hypothetical protein
MSVQATAVRPDAAVRDRNFYLGMAIACVLIVFVGFSPSYFLTPFFERPAAAPPPSIYLHLHAGIFTSWLALFVAQTALVRSDRRDLHRRLGILGLVIAIALVTINFATVANAIEAGRSSTLGPPTTRLYIALSSSLIAAGYIFAGLHWRRDRDAHKRLMLLATISMIGPAMNRVARQLDLGALLGIDGRLLSPAAVLVLLAAGMLHDYRQRRRVHPVYIVGVAVLIGSRVLGRMVAQTEAWRSLASWILS